LIERAIAETCVDVHVRAYFRFLIALGCRKTEALSLHWSDVTLAGRDSSVAFRNTKNGEDRVVPLPATIVDQLSTLQRVADNPFVFAGRRSGQPLQAVAKAWQRIRQHAGLPQLRLHDLRRSFGSWLGDAGFTSKQIGTVLGHKTDITSRVYMALGHESKRAAVDAVQAVLDAARRGTHEVAEVRALRGLTRDLA
jgi:integrase